MCFNSRVWKYPELLGRYLRWVYIGTTWAVDLPYLRPISNQVWFTSKVLEYPELPGKLSRTYHDHFVDEALIGLNQTIRDRGLIVPAGPHC